MKVLMCEPICVRGKYSATQRPKLFQVTGWAGGVSSRQHSGGTEMVLGFP